MPTENITEATSPSNWTGGRKYGFVIELPSGNKARIRRTLSMVNMIKSGSVPNPLQSQIKKMLEAGRESQELPPAIEDFKEEEWVALLELIDSEIPLIFVEPKVELVPDGEDPNFWQPEDPNSLSIVDLAYQDRIYAYNVAQGGPADLGRFLETQKALAALANEQRLQPKTIPNTESQ